MRNVESVEKAWKPHGYSIIFTYRHKRPLIHQPKGSKWQNIKSTHTIRRDLFRFIFDKQILPGTFEYTLSYLIDNEIDLSLFDNRYNNDETGAPAYDPSILLKIVLYAYSRGIVSSRKIARCCQENIIFMALSSDTRPHFTTIADFISSMGNEVLSLFRDVLLICDEMKLIGKDMFAIDGCKMPSNASKEWSGTKAEFNQKKQKVERAIRRI